MARKTKSTTASTGQMSLLSRQNSNSTKKKISSYSNPTYRMRKLTNKGAIFVIIWNFLLASVPYYLMEYVPRGLKVGLVAWGFTMPFAGWLADVHFGRYKVIRWSMWIMWTASMLATLSSVVAHLVESYSKANKYVTIAAGFVMAIGFGGYQANVIQFGLDQLQDASTTEITAFIQWYYWTYFSSRVVSELTHTCLKEEYQLLGHLIVCVSITIVIVLSFIFHNILIKEPVTQNPLKLLYKVIHYAIKNKNPGRRSPFFYWEDELPSCIDFGKSKYGGPFTIEQVEDVKTFLRLLVIVVVASALIGEIFLQNYPSDHLINVLLNVQSLTPFSGECYRETFFITTLEYIATAVYIPLQEFILYPMLQRYLPSIKMYQMLVLGMVLQMARVITLMVFDITAR